VKIVVFGASGGTGLQIVRQALAKGDDVTAVARRPDVITDEFGERVDVRKGDVLDPASLEGAFENANAVLSALGAHVGRQPTRVYSEGMRNIRAQMAAAGVRRVIAITSDPLSNPTEKRPIDRWVAHPLMHFFFKGSTEDARLMEAELAAAGAAGEVDWTVFRPGRLLDGPQTDRYRISIGKALRAATAVGRADLAAAMLAAIDDPAMMNNFVSISR
jgi:putative NADH-flavin reductase